MTRSVTVGVLALQGAFAAHLSILRDLGVEACEVKTNEQLALVDGLVIPGGESTTMSMLLMKGDMLDPLLQVWRLDGKLELLEQL